MLILKHGRSVAALGPGYRRKARLLITVSGWMIHLRNEKRNWKKKIYNGRRIGVVTR